MPDEFLGAVQELKRSSADGERRLENKIDKLWTEVHELALRIASEIKHSETIESLVGAMTTSLIRVGANSARLDAIEKEVAAKAEKAEVAALKTELASKAPASRLAVAYWAIALQWPLLLAILWFLIKRP